MNNLTLTSIVSVIALVAIIAFIILYMIKHSKEKGYKEIVQNFLESLKDEIFKSIIKTINKTNFSEFSSLEELESVLFVDIYDTIWNFVEAQAKEAFAEDPLKDVILELITKDNVTKFVNMIIETEAVSSIIEEKATAFKIEVGSDDIVKEDEALQDKFADQNEYVEESNDDELAPAEKEVPTQEELAALNPQKDEPEVYSDDDSSVEVIPQEKIIMTKSKNGATLFYIVDENGKRTKTSRRYVMQSGITPIEE